MSLRNRLLLLLGSLLILLAAADWWLVRSLTGELSTELGRVAESVGHSVVSMFTTTTEVAPESPGSGDLVVVGEPDSETYQFRFTDSEVEPDPGRHTSGKHALEEHAIRRREISEFVDEDQVEGTLVAEGSTIGNLRIVVSDDGSRVDISRSGASDSIPVPSAGVARVLDRFSRRLLLGSLGLVGLALVAGAFMVHRETRPLQELAAAARAVGGGRLGTQAPLGGSGEVAQAVGAFNQMSLHLRDLQNEALEHRERQHLGEIGEIARGLAHSLRNPLNTLGLSVDRLAEADDEAQGRQLAGTAREQIRRIDRTLKSILVLTTAESVETEQVDVRSLLRDVTLELLQSDRSGIEIDLQTTDVPTVIYGMVPELRVMLQVILENAVEASPPGGKIRVGLEAPSRSVPPDEYGEAPADAARVRIEVADRGPGLSGSVREQLFSPHLTTKPQGAGMGLFLAHRLATRRYSGDLKLGDRDGGGTVASLQLADRLEETNA